MDGRPLILIVEDEPDLAALTGEILLAEGYEVLVAGDGRHALELLESAAPRVVVTDLMMPRLDGFGLISEYLKRPGPKAPVLAVSAFEPFLEKAVELGAAEALAKPFELEALLERVERLAGRRGDLPGGAPPRPLRPVRAGPDEAARLQAVLRLRLDEPAPTRALDDFSERVARLFDVPICLVSVVTAEHQYWHAFCAPGEPPAARAGRREDSFCTHAVAARAALVVQDAAEHPFFSANDAVRRSGLRFYAGVPLLSRFGEALGTLCILDRAPRAFGYFDLELLGVLGRRVLAELEWRERRDHPDAPSSGFRYLDYLDRELDVLGREALEQALTVESARAAERRSPLALLVAALPEGADLAGAARALERAFPRAHLGRLAFRRLGVLAPDLAADEARRRAAAALPAGAEWRAAGAPQRLGGARALLHELERALGTAGLAAPAA